MSVKWEQNRNRWGIWEGFRRLAYIKAGPKGFYCYIDGPRGFISKAKSLKEAKRLCERELKSLQEKSYAS